MKRHTSPSWLADAIRPEISHQVSTESGASESEQVIVLDDELPSGILDCHIVQSLDAMRSLSPPTVRPQSSSRSGTCRRASKKPGKRKGGWRKTTGLTWWEVKSIHATVMALSKAGKRLTMFVSIRPPSHIIDDAKRKKLCYRLESHLAQKLGRLGLPFIALRVFEKDIGGLLHLHLLIHVPRRWLNHVACWSDGIVTHIRPAVRKHVSYITKQRHSLPPDAEKAVSHHRKKGEPFKGRRWSLTKDAKAVLAASSR